MTQRELAARVGASRRAVQAWEVGVNLPSPERLQALMLVLLDAGGLTVGREMGEAQDLWTAVHRATTLLTSSPTWALSADGHLLASASLDRTVRLWSTADGRLLAALPADGSSVYRVALSADGNVRLWDARHGQPLATLEGTAAWCTG